jgi:hypothetical protein
MPFGSQVVAYVPEVTHPLQLSHCAPVPLGLLEQLTPFCLLPFNSRPPSCCLGKTITVLIMCGAEACPLLIVVLNRSAASLMGMGERGECYGQE